VSSRIDVLEQQDDGLDPHEPTHVGGRWITGQTVARSEERPMAEHPELGGTDGEVILAVHVQPGAGRTEVVGRHGDALKLRVAAPPTGDRANAAVVDLVAKEFNVKPAAVRVVSGATSRDKRLELKGLDRKAAERIVDRLLDAPRLPTRR
jgi:uncharacterized protein (TIGR00251 family)